jgi:hypothetical protein
VLTADVPDDRAETESWKLPTLREHFTLETRRLTLVYWGALSLLAIAVFIPRLLPCVDYPQHLGLSELARRLADPDAPVHSGYTLNYFTYNGLFHFATAKLGTFVPLETAGRTMVAVSLLLLGASVLALLKVTKRPPSYAALFVPVIFSFSLAWGFVNYALGTAVAVLTLVFVARSAIKASVLHVLAVAALGLLCAFAHVLAMIVLCLVGAAIVPELAWRSSKKMGARFGKAVLALAPLLVGCWFCIKVYQEQYLWDPGMYKDPVVEGTAPPIWQKILMFSAFGSDLYDDRSDQVVLVLCILTMGYLAWRARRGSKAPGDRPLYLPLAVMFVAYLATPMVFIGTHLIFPRLAQWVVLGAVLATPAVAPPLAEKARRWAHGLGAFAAVSLVAHCTVFAIETNDASRVLDDLPTGRGATAIVYDSDTVSFRAGALVHLAAYYAARKQGTWAFSFARYLSVPVRFKPGGQPAWPYKGWEFTPEDYNPRCKYARAFDLVIIRAPHDAPSEADVRRRVFKQDADAVKLLAHHGQYWAFDTKGLPEDGTL